MNEHHKQRIQDQMEMRGLSPETIECYLECLKLFMHHFRGKGAYKITIEDLKNYHKTLRNRGQSNRTSICRCRPSGSFIARFTSPTDSI